MTNVADMRYWANWVANAVWESDDNKNMGLAHQLFMAKPDVIRAVARTVRGTFPYPHLLKPSKLYHGLRHSNPSLKVIRRTDWSRADGRVIAYKSFTESVGVACYFAHDAQAIAEYTAQNKHVKHVPVIYDEHGRPNRPAPTNPGADPDGDWLPLDEPWGTGFIGTLGKDLPQDAILFHWRFLFEHPGVGPTLLNEMLNPRQPHTLVEDEQQLLGYVASFEYLLDLDLLPNVNVTRWEKTCLKDPAFQKKSLASAASAVEAVATGNTPAPSPAFPNPRIR